MTRKITHAILIGALLAGMPVAASPLVRDGPSAPPTVRRVAADCYAVGQSIASQKGGTLAAAQAGTRGGQAVCVIVVLIPGEDGKRPRREEIVVPQ